MVIDTEVVPPETTSDAIPLETVDIDGLLIVCTWYTDSGVNRWSLTADTFGVGAVDSRGSAELKLLPDQGMAQWLSLNDHTDQVLASAKRLWRTRIELLPQTPYPHAIEHQVLWEESEIP